MTDSSDLRDQVQARYAAAAKAVTDPETTISCAALDNSAAFDERSFGAVLYDSGDAEVLPADAVAASLGCGVPTEVADLHEGEIVLDLGSGGGIDVLLSARRVGPTGRVSGMDMDQERLPTARANAEKVGVLNVEFLHGHIEAIPLPDEAVDVVISNCVINLSVDKPAVFAEMFRVLKAGGRIGVSDVVADDELSPAERMARGSTVGCIAGALTFAEYRAGLETEGFIDIEISPIRQVAEQMHAAIVRARKP